MPPIDPEKFRRLALLLAASGASACGGGSEATTTPRHTDPTVGGNGNPPVVEGYVATPGTGYCDYATGTYYDPTGEAWWNGGPDGTCYAPTDEGYYGGPTGEGYVDPSGEYYPPVYEG